MNNPITEIITKYAKERSTDYAILISGEWGCGKTYYWKNVLSKKIEKIKAIGNKKNYKPVYISLNGISNCNQIDDRLINALSRIGEFSNYLSNFDSGGGTVEGIKNAVASVLKFGNNIFLLRDEKLKELFICFDDLERISNKIEFDEIIGYINTNFIEHNSIKTIVLTDLSKGKLKKKKNHAILEKYFERTIQFKFDADYIIDAISKSYIKENVDYHDFLEKNKEFIVDLIIDADIENIRTIKFAIRILDEIYSAIDKYDIPLVEKSIIFFTISIANEFKNGNLKSSDSDRNMLFLNTFEFAFRTGISKRANENEKTNVDSNKDEKIIFQKQYYQKYIKENYSDLYEYFDSIYKFILTGILIIENVKNEINQLLGRTNKFDADYYKLNNYNELSDQEFTQIYDNVLSYIEGGKYDLYSYSEKFMLIYFIQRKVYNDKDKIALIKKFKYGINIAKSNTEYDYEKYSTMKTRSHSDINKEILEFIEEIHAELRTKHYTDKVNKIFIDIKDKDKYHLVEYNSVATQPIFSQFQIDKFLLILKDCNNKALSRIARFIHHHGENIKHYPDTLKVERKFFVKLLKELNNYLKSEDWTSGSVRKSNYYEIVESVEYILSD